MFKKSRTIHLCNRFYPLFLIIKTCHMKKRIFIILIVLVFGIALFQSCKSTQECPAYGDSASAKDVETEQIA